MKLLLIILKMNFDGEKADAKLDQDDLDAFYLEGSYAGTDNGELYANKTRFKTLVKDTVYSFRLFIWCFTSMAKENLSKE